MSLTTAFGSNPAEQPNLWLATVGFFPDQQAAIEAALPRWTGAPCWHLSDFGEADGWLVNGGNCSLLPGGELMVAPGLPTERSVRLDLSEVQRPVAFSTPLACDELEPLCTFDPRSQGSIHGAVLQFDGWLTLLRAQFELGSQIVQLGAKLRHGIFHLSYQDRLLAVLDFREGRGCLAPHVHPADLRRAQWDKRPSGAGVLPPGFISISPVQLTWIYVRRSHRDLLPARYREEMLYFRRAPRVPLRLLSDSQLVLLRLLTIQPSTMAALGQRISHTSRQLEHDLTCLYYAGSITTTRSKAAAAGVVRGEESHTTYRADFTAPGMLQPEDPAYDGSTVRDSSKRS